MQKSLDKEENMDLLDEIIVIFLPYVDENFENNILLTKTEMLTMNGE